MGALTPSVKRKDAYHKKTRPSLLKLAFFIKATVFSVSILASETGVSEALLEAKNVSKQVSETGAKSDTNQAESGKEAAKAKQATQAARAHDERLQILHAERQAILEKIAATGDDPKALARHRSDYAAIQREIASVGTSAPITKKTSTERPFNGDAVQTHAAPSAAKPTRRYEGWDIFRNFGTKED